MNECKPLALGSMIRSLLTRIKIGRGAIEHTHSTDVESSPPPLQLRMSIHPGGKSCSDVGRVRVLNDPYAHSP